MVLSRGSSIYFLIAYSTFFMPKIKKHLNYIYLNQYFKRKLISLFIFKNKNIDYKFYHLPFFKSYKFCFNIPNYILLQIS